MILLRPLALAGVVLLGACSEEAAVQVSAPSDPSGVGGDTAGVAGGGEGDGSNGDATAGGVDGNPGTGGPATGGEGADPGGAPSVAGPIPGATVLPEGSRAGAYVGTLDDGEGVFVIDREGRMLGLASRTDGSAVSWFADFATGTASTTAAARFEHASDDGDAAGPASPLGRPGGLGPELGLIDGERIARVAGETEVSLEAGGRSTLASLDAAAVLGRWRGEHVDCDSLGEHCSTQLVDLAIDGGSLSGSSGVFTADGADLFPVPMSGAFVPLGDFAEVVFEWNTYDYTGVMHFVPDDTDRIVLIGRTDRELADHPVFAVVLTRAPGA